MILAFLIAVVVLALAVAAWIDWRDRKDGRTRKSSKQLAADIKTARAHGRAQVVKGGLLARMRPDHEPPTTGYRPPDGRRRPVKRGQ